MAGRSFLARFLTTRRAIRDLGRIASALEQQLPLLTRIADKLDPPPPLVDEVTLRSTGPSFSRDVEQGRILDFVERVYRDTGREPTEEEIVQFLEGEPV